MRATLFLLSNLGFLLWGGFFVGDVSGLVIYRFGGQQQALPAEVGEEGVEFVQLSWTDLDPSLGGKVIELDMDGAAIQPLEWDPNFNIAPGIEIKGGEHVRPNVNVEVWDGDPSTVWTAASYLCSQLTRLFCVDDFGRQGTANIKLGSGYLIDRVRIVSGLSNPSKIVRTVRVYIAPEVPWKKTSLIDHPPAYTPFIVEVRDSRKQVLDIPIPPHEGSTFVQVAIGEHNEDWEVHEIEIYAKGFVAEATYISDIIDFGVPMAWGDLRWGGRKESKAEVLIQTRSGQDDDVDLFWRFTGRGKEKARVSRADYDNLKVGEKAGTTHDKDHWTFWSAPYDFAQNTGVPIVSLSPRRYFQFKVDFLSRDDDSGQLDFLELRASQPVASNLVGEIWPVETPVGETAHFTYVLRPTIRATDAGFDRLEIETPSIVHAVEAVRIGEVAVDYQLEVHEPHRLAVRFARLESRDSGTLVEVTFEAQVLRYGATFEGRVSDSTQPLEVPQGINAGDATGKYEGNRVSVATSVSEQTLVQVDTPSAVFTPNGDGRNDGVRIGYTIFEITGSAQVEVGVWDLSGHRLRQVYAGLDGIGTYEQVWDGRDAAGQVVPPGIYLYRILVDTDKDAIQKMGLLHVAY